MNFFLKMSSMNLVRAGLDNQNLNDLLIPSGVGLAEFGALNVCLYMCLCVIQDLATMRLHRDGV